MAQKITILYLNLEDNRFFEAIQRGNDRWIPAANFQEAECLPQGCSQISVKEARRYGFKMASELKKEVIESY